MEKELQEDVGEDEGVELSAVPREKTLWSSLMPTKMTKKEKKAVNQGQDLTQLAATMTQVDYKINFAISRAECVFTEQNLKLQNEIQELRLKLATRNDTLTTPAFCGAVEVSSKDYDTLKTLFPSIHTIAWSEFERAMKAIGLRLQWIGGVPNNTFEIDPQSPLWRRKGKEDVYNVDDDFKDGAILVKKARELAEDIMATFGIDLSQFKLGSAELTEDAKTYYGGEEDGGDEDDYFDSEPGHKNNSIFDESND